jgi:hypothetical protein
MQGTEIRFCARARGIISLLEVASPGRRSVLEAVQRLLFGLRVQIVQVESVVQPDGLLERFHVVEFDGAPLGPRREEVIRSTVLKALCAVQDVA